MFPFIYDIDILKISASHILTLCRGKQFEAELTAIPHKLFKPIKINIDQKILTQLTLNEIVIGNDVAYCIHNSSIYQIDLQG